MYILFSVVVVLLSLVMILVVLVQNSKGGGLAAGFASSNQVMGVRKTTDFLEKTTYWLAGLIVAFCVLASLALPKNGTGAESQIKQEIQNTAPAQGTGITPFETPEEAPVAPLEEPVE
jgi:preprotein translocase subunit SecG